jgi:hypothetical protein
MTQDDPESARNEAPRRLGALSQAGQLTEETAQRLLSLVERSEPVRRIRGSQIATGIIGTMGFALFIVGVERAAEDIPIISNPYGSIVIGIILLAVTGLLIRRLAGHD